MPTKEVIPTTVSRAEKKPNPQTKSQGFFFVCLRANFGQFRWLQTLRLKATYQKKQGKKCEKYGKEERKTTSPLYHMEVLHLEEGLEGNQTAIKEGIDCFKNLN